MKRLELLFAFLSCYLASSYCGFTNKVIRTVPIAEIPMHERHPFVYPSDQPVTFSTELALNQHAADQTGPPIIQDAWINS